MVTGILAATLSSPVCPPLEYIFRANVEGSMNFSSYPSQASYIYSGILVSIFVMISFMLLFSSRKSQSSTETSSSEENGSHDDASSKAPIAIASAILFSISLFVSKMSDPRKILSFLNVGLIATRSWDGTLLLVMGFGLIFSALGYHFVEEHNILKVPTYMIHDDSLIRNLNIFLFCIIFSIPFNHGDRSNYV